MKESKGPGFHALEGLRDLLGMNFANLELLHATLYGRILS